jgi:hypothetical protein
MQRTLWIFIICLYAINIQYTDINYSQQQRHKYKLQYSNGIPTTLGINMYINSPINQKHFIAEYQTLIKDSIYNDIYFSTETAKDKTAPLAYNDISLNSSCEIVVSNNERYRAFEYYDSLKYMYNENDNFLKATIFHEISHYYFTQVILEMTRVKHLKVNQYYIQNITMFPNQELQYGEKFIEEGFCEYIIQKFHLCPIFNNISIPQTKADLLNPKKNYEYQYVYSSRTLSQYLDSCILKDGNVKRGLMLILSDRPPNFQEILKPKYYYHRLKSQTLTPIDSIY